MLTWNRWAWPAFLSSVLSSIAISLLIIYRIMIAPPWSALTYYAGIVIVVAPLCIVVLWAVLSKPQGGGFWFCVASGGGIVVQLVVLALIGPVLSPPVNLIECPPNQTGANRQCTCIYIPLRQDEHLREDHPCQIIVYEPLPIVRLWDVSSE